MSPRETPYRILMADDDAEDCLLVQEALGEAGLGHELRFVRDGEELLDYLLRRGEYADGRAAPRPDLILLDWKMPRLDGRETLRLLRGGLTLRTIPVVVLSTSTAADDVCAAYELGVNSFISKPVTFRGLVDILKGLSDYWFKVVELPPATGP